MMEELKLDVLCLTETWLKMNEECAFPPMCNVLRNDRPTRGGGVSIILMDYLKMCAIEVDISDWKTPHSVEFLCVTVQNNYYKSAVICVVYRTKYISNDLYNLDLLFEFLCNLGKRVYVLGDFNVNYFDTNNKHCKSLCNILERHDLTQFTQHPTRDNNLLDWILSNDKSHMDVKMHDFSISDHLLSTCEILFYKKKTQCKTSCI